LPLLDTSGSIEFGIVAQWSEQGTHNPLVLGSNPSDPNVLKGFLNHQKPFSFWLPPQLPPRLGCSGVAQGNVMSMPKFGTFDPHGDPVVHDYGNVFFRQPCGGGERLVIGPTGKQMKLLDELAATFPTQRYYVLYILLLSHAGRSPGRYQSPLINSHEALQLFVSTFQKFFEGDGRHHLWIASPDSSDLLVYDQHDVVFAYGNLNVFESILDKDDYEYKEFWFPSPHAHGYDPANVNAEDDLMSYFDWKYFELQPGDEWN
jgi:hypothetical protein